MSLNRLGWTPRFQDAFDALNRPDLAPARVAREHRDRYLVVDAEGERPAELAGRLRHEAGSRVELPAVGDWVAVGAVEGGDAGSAVRIVAVLPRATAFLRKEVGARDRDPRHRTAEAQVVAANVDTVFIVSGLDGDFNLRRIERYLAAAWESGASPVVLLNKADLAIDLEARVADVETIAIGVPVLALSALDGRGLDALAPWLGPARTVALLGSSGVGKSTLVNALLGVGRQSTAPVREHDSRGRHTTTQRELVPLPGGAWLVDTPGMRVLQLWTGDEDLAGAFPDIAALAAACRFRDCDHESEPGCAVRAAIDGGALDPSRLGSWRKLQREREWLATRQDVRASAARKARWKAIHKSMKHHPKARRNR